MIKNENMIKQVQLLKFLQDPEITPVRMWLINNKLYDKFKQEIGINNPKNSTDQIVSIMTKSSSSDNLSIEKCINTFYMCSSYVDYRKLHMKQYLWLRRNNLLKDFQKRINYSKYDSVANATKYRGRDSITYDRCVDDWNNGNFKFKSDYYRCFSGNLKFLKRNNLLDKFLTEVLK